jgi:4'-phosphopantetheinyl transferase
MEEMAGQMSGAAATWKTTPANLELPSDRIDIWRVCLDSFESPEPGFSGILSQDEVARASRFHFENDRRRFVRCRIALRALLGSYLDVPPAGIRFRYGGNGKPEIAGPQHSRGLRFNVSNSRGLALIAVSSGRAIGVDIERVRPKVECLDIARRFFSAREIEALLALGENKRQEAFFACWTRKEAFLKSTGDGLTCPLSEFSVSVDPDGPAELWDVKGDPNAVSHWCLESVRPGAGYIGALAYKGPVCRVEWLCRDCTSCLDQCQITYA